DRNGLDLLFLKNQNLIGFEPDRAEQRAVNWSRKGSIAPQMVQDRKIRALFLLKAASKPEFFLCLELIPYVCQVVNTVRREM
ncbi:hypothetical protein KI387_012595, partial [Taxus chinensis]